MCTPDLYKQMGSMQNGNNIQSSGAKSAPSSLGNRLDQAQRLAASTTGGGTFQGKTILQGVPRNSDVDALRKTTLMGV